MARSRRRSLIQRSDPPLVDPESDLDFSEPPDPAEPPPLPVVVPASAFARPASAPNRSDGVARPPDPGLVDFDLRVHELPDLPIDAIDVIEEIDDFEELDDPELFEPIDDDEGDTAPGAEVRGRVPAPATPAGAAAAPAGPAAPAPSASKPTGRAAPPDRPRHRASATPAPARRSRRAPSTAGPLGAELAATFFGTLTATMLLVLLPWFTLVSPTLEASRARRQAERVAVAAPPVAIAPTPAVPSEPVAVAEPEPVAVDEPAVDEPAVDEPAVDEPAAVDEPVAVAKAPPPAPRPRPRAAAKPPEPEPEPAPKAAPAPAPKPAPPAVPPDVAALSGSLAGTVGGEPVSLGLTFQANGRLAARIQRGDAPAVDARGTWTNQFSGVGFSVTEPGADALTYTGVADRSGATGQAIGADGKKRKLKVRR